MSARAKTELLSALLVGTLVVGAQALPARALGQAPAAGEAPGEEVAEAGADPVAEATGQVEAAVGKTREELSAEKRVAGAEALLERALAAASQADWKSSAVHAHQAWQLFPTSEERREAAELALADALLKLGFTQGAASHYFNIVERRHMPQLLPRALAGVEALSHRGLVLEEDLMRGVLAEADLANVPPDLADFLHYQRGIANLRLGNKRWTEYEFRRIEDDGVYGQRARLAQAVSMVRDNEPARALEAVESILAADPAPDVMQEALLIQGRLLFEAGRFPEAVEAFRQVDGTRNVPGGEVLLERAWGHYREGRLHDAMGLIYALGAPAHVELFLPDAYVLRGLIYQRFCHYRAARSASAAFRARYGDAITAVEAGTPPAQVETVALATSIRPHVAAVLRVADAARAEIALLEKEGPSLQEGGLRAHLAQLYGLMGSRLERTRRLAVEQGADEIAERLLAAREQANLLEYEVGVSIHKRLNDAEGKVYRRPEAQVVPRTGDKNFYKFNGEFWSDELGDMRFLIENRCVE